MHFTWLQATQIGLDAFLDNTELVGFVTELRTGKPLAGVDLSIYPNGKSVGGGQASVVGEEKGFIARAWDWLTSFAADQMLARPRRSRLTARRQQPKQCRSVADRTGDNGILAFTAT